LSGIYLSGSVTAILGILFGVLILFLTSIRIKMKIFNFLFIFILFTLVLYFLGEIAGIPFFQFKSNSSFNVITRSFSRVQNITANSRMVIYLQALKNIIQSPIIGAGFDQISTSGIEVNVRELENAVHNTLLQIWYIGGFFALFGYLIIYIKLSFLSIRRLWNYKKRNLNHIIAGLASVTLTILLMDQFQDSIYQREKWLVIGLFLSYELRNKIII